jgi:hypothetical protein
MKSHQLLTEDNLQELSSIVTDTVCDYLNGGSKPSISLIERLRTYEQTARDADLGAQTIQVIASGRRLLGDGRDLSPR